MKHWSTSNKPHTPLKVPCQLRVVCVYANITVNIAGEFHEFYSLNGKIHIKLESFTKSGLNIENWPAWGMVCTARTCSQHLSVLTDKCKSQNQNKINVEVLRVTKVTLELREQNKQAAYHQSQKQAVIESTQNLKEEKNERITEACVRLKSANVNIVAI